MLRIRSIYYLLPIRRTMDEELLQDRLADMDDRIKEGNKQLYRIANTLERLLKISEMSL